MRRHACLALVTLFLPLSISFSNEHVGRTVQENDSNIIINLRRRHTSSSFQSQQQTSIQERTANEGLSHLKDPLKDLFHPRDIHLDAPAECELNQDGYYGTQRGDTYNIEFLYQIHVVPNTRPSALRVLIVPALDETLTASLLPDFFDCEDGSPLSPIQAINWHPVDQLVESGLTCDPDLTISRLDCFVVQGFLTVHAIGSNKRIVTHRILSSIQKNIGKLKTSVVQKVDYIGTDLFDLVPSLYEDTIDVPMPPPIAPPPSSTGTLVPTRVFDTAEPSGGSEPTPTVPSAAPMPTSSPNTPSAPTPTNLAPTRDPNAPTKPTTAPLVPTLVPSTGFATPTVSPNVRLSVMPSLTVSPTEPENVPTHEPTTSYVPSMTKMPSTLSSIAPTRTVETEESSRGFNRIKWWGWLLLVLAVVFFVMMSLYLVRMHGFHSERKLRSVRPETVSSGVLTKMEQARQEYIPPGLKTNHGLIPSTR